MVDPYDLPRLLRQISKPLLRDLLARHGVLQDFPWERSSETFCESVLIDYSDRINGSQFFTAYLDDWPENQVPITNDVTTHPCCQECLFWSAFLFNPIDGSLELLARDGGAVCLPLQQIFCHSVLGIDLGLSDPMEPAYRLGMLLEPGFAFVTDPNDRIAQVCLRHVRLESQVSPGPWEYQELKFQTQTDLIAAVKEIQRGLAFHGLRHAQVLVRQAAIQLLFLPNAQGRAEELVFGVTVPNVCDLKNNPDDLWAVGEHCLRLWGIACV